MPLPNLDEKQFKWVAGEVAAYIGGQRRLHLAAAVPLTTEQREKVSRFFRRTTLDSVRLRALEDGHFANPPFYGELVKMGFESAALPDFSKMAAITFVDVVAFRGEITTEILFHELVHATQYELLGLTKFAELYARGFLEGGSYEEIPLEMHAYSLGNRFATAGAQGFSVHDDVLKLVQAGLY